MISVPLTRGYIALIDEQDAHLAEFRWCSEVRSGGLVYAVRTVPRPDGRPVGLKLHREVLGLEFGDGKIVDHINGDGLDCRRENLRVVTKQENCRNRGGAMARNASRFLGVYPHGPGWIAKIGINGELLYLGAFPTPEAANLARLVYEKEIWGIQPRRLAAFQAAGLA